MKKEDISKILPQLMDFIKKADEVSFEITFGTASIAGDKQWLEIAYNGKSKIIFDLYHKEHDNSDNLLKKNIKEAHEKSQGNKRI